MLAVDPEDCHVVVFDCNIYLDVARCLRPPFTSDRFVEATGAAFAPTYTPSGIDSCIALGYARADEFIPGQPMSVWSSDWIENATALMAQASLTSEYPGLALSDSDTDDLFFEVIDLIVPERNVVTVDGRHQPPGLSRDDARVLETALTAGDHELNKRYVITKDRAFREHGDPSGRVTFLYPHQFVSLVRESRQALQRRGPIPGT